MFLNRVLFIALAALFLLWPFEQSRALFGISARKAQNQMLTQAQEAYDDAQYKRVEELGKEFLLKYPSASKKRLKTMYLLLGDSYKERGQYDKALLTYNEAAEFLPKDEDVNLALGGIYLIGGLTDNAKDIFRKVLEINKENKDALLGMARAYYEEGLFSRANVFFEYYRQAGGEEISGPFFYYYAMSQYLADNQDEALDLALKALSAEETADTLFLLAKIYRNGDDEENAWLYIDAALDKDPSRYDIYLTKALWLSFGTLEQNKQAEKMADFILKKNSRDKLALFIKYLSLRKRGGDSAKAREYLRTIMSMEGDQLMDKMAAKLYYMDMSGKTLK